MESERDKARKRLQERLDIKQDYLDYVASLVQTVPDVQRSADADRWQLGVLDSAPPETYTVPLDSYSSELEVGNEFIRRMLPTPQQSRRVDAVVVASVSSGGTVSVLEYMNQAASRLATPAVSSWRDTNLAALSHLQQEQDRTGAIRSCLDSMGIPGLAEKFDAAVTGYLLWRANTLASARAAAANEMRVFVDKLKGELFGLAHLQREGSKQAMWESMAHTIGKGDRDGTQQRLLIAEWPKRQSLYEQLSDIAKGWDDKSPLDLQRVWIGVLEHTSTVIGLVNASPSS